jgi:hypothetical protein
VPRADVLLHRPVSDLLRIGDSSAGELERVLTAVLA